MLFARIPKVPRTVQINLDILEMVAKINVTKALILFSRTREWKLETHISTLKMIKLVMCLGIFPIESVAMNFTDINECSEGTSNCSADAMCNNTEGSYRCKRKPGFTGNGRT